MVSQIKYGWNVAGSNTNLLKWKKTTTKKIILFHSKHFLSTFWWKGLFLDITSAELSLLRLVWYRCCKFVFDDLLNILISMARSFKYFHNVELLYPSDEFQTLWIFNMFTIMDKRTVSKPKLLHCIAGLTDCPFRNDCEKTVKHWVCFSNSIVQSLKHDVWYVSCSSFKGNIDSL